MNKLDKLLSSIAIFACLSVVAISVNAQDDLFTELDANADGMISVEEAQEHDVLFENFASVDADSDGYVTKEELAEAGIN